MQLSACTCPSAWPARLQDSPWWRSLHGWWAVSGLSALTETPHRSGVSAEDSRTGPALLPAALWGFGQCPGLLAVATPR